MLAILRKNIRTFFLLCLSLSLSACSNLIVLNPKGPIGASEKNLILIAAGLMLLVVLPAIFLTCVFAFRYRNTNKNAKYTPEWSRAKSLEIIFWSVPAFIIFILSLLVWKTSHSLDPYKPLPSNQTPLVIQVVSMDWKWLFIYPEQHIAVVNELELPVNRPIHFFLTSSTVMNAFFIPQLGSQIMTMAGMQTQLYLLANSEGNYMGISSNFSGMGFTGMRFNAHVVSQEKFAAWITQTQKQSDKFTDASYQTLTHASVNNPVTYFADVPPNLFMMIMNSYQQRK